MVFLKANNAKVKIRLWKDIEKIFSLKDKKIFDRNLENIGRIEFILKVGARILPIGNIQINVNSIKESHEYEITGVNTEHDFQMMGMTTLYFSWVILYLMYKNPDDDFRIIVQNGVEIKKIWAETNKYVYHNIFDNYEDGNNLKDWVNREFLIIRRDEEKGFFEELLREKEDVLRQHCTKHA